MSLTEDERGLLRHKAPATLPDGVDAAAWAEEQNKVQNPRLKAFMGSIDRLEEVRVSNYTILHCSPARLLDMLERVWEVAGHLRSRIAPLLRTPSCIPELESARQSIGLYHATIEESVLRELDRIPDRPTEDLLPQIRQLLCVAIGKLHAFLVDSQSQLLAADPRSARDSEWFLARKFPRDVEEAEWLHRSVLRLAALVEELEKGRDAALVEPAARLRREGFPTDGPSLDPAIRFVDAVRGQLLPRLVECLALEGIRVQEIELIDRFLAAMAPDCALVLELRSLGELLATGLPAAEGVAAGELVAGRLADLLMRIDLRLRDLAAFLPIWEDGVGRRRALLLQRSLAAGGQGRS